MKHVIKYVEKNFLIRALRQHLRVDPKFTDELMVLNLFSFFIQDEDAAIHWLDFLEEKFSITIPDAEADFFFFSNIDQMAVTINMALQRADNDSR